MSTGSVKKMLVNPQAGFKKEEYERLKQILATYDEGLALDAAKNMIFLYWQEMNIIWKRNRSKKYCEIVL